MYPHLHYSEFSEFKIRLIESHYEAFLIYLFNRSSKNNTQKIQKIEMLRMDNSAIRITKEEMDNTYNLFNWVGSLFFSQQHWYSLYQEDEEMYYVLKE